MKTNTFMDNAAIGAVLAAILVNVLHGALVAATDVPLAGDPVPAEVRHV